MDKGKKWLDWRELQMGERIVFAEKIRRFVCEKSDFLCFLVFIIYW